MYQFIINPASKSGKAAQIWIQLQELLKQEKINYRFYITEKSGDAARFAKILTSDSSQQKHILFVLGGDGTVNEVLQGIQDLEHTLLGYIPSGSSNDLARDLGIVRPPSKQLMFLLNSPKIHAMDIGVLSCQGIDRRFAIGCGIGFDAAVCAEALTSPIKKFCNYLGMGELTYLGIAIKQLLFTQNTACKIYADGRLIYSLPSFYFAVSMIHRYEGGGFKFCPDADDSDGLLDLCIAGHIPKWKILFVLPSAFNGRHLRFKNVESCRARTLRIKTSAPLWVQTDGEVRVHADDITLTCMKQALKILV